MNTRAVGTEKETDVCAFLQKEGVRIAQQNFRCRQGEIDVIGYHGEYLVFFEVKYRKSNRAGGAAEAVDWRKQQKICAVSDYYRLVHRCEAGQPVRYDVVAVDGGRIQWHQNAFAYLGNG